MSGRIIPSGPATSTVGEPGEPVIVRVETPAWAARRNDWAATMQSVLVHQSRLTAGPIPTCWRGRMNWRWLRRATRRRWSSVSSAN